MKLIIDIGNSATKLAVFEAKTLVYNTSFATKQLKDEYKIIRSAYPMLNSAIVSSVGKLQHETLSYIKRDIICHFLTHQSKLPFKNQYGSPSTLGADRIALASAAALHYPKKPVLVIDAGTCITYDFVDKDNVYHGGAISPGIRLRYSSLNNFTAKLPLLETKQPEHLVGKTTESSIHSGVVNGTVKEIDGVIDEYKNRYQDLTVILTGGDTEFLSNQLKNGIFAHLNFLLEGLNYILDYNS